MTTNSPAADPIRNLKTTIAPIVDDFIGKHFDAIVCSVCTEDGFDVAQSNSSRSSIEPDKMASISSTLLSMADAAVQNIKAGELNQAIVDSESANLIVRRARARERNVVLSLAVSKSVSIGKALYAIGQLQTSIEALE